MNIQFESGSYTLREVVSEVREQLKADSDRWVRHTFGPRWTETSRTGITHEVAEDGHITEIYWEIVRTDRWGRRRTTYSWTQTPYGSEQAWRRHMDEYKARLNAEGKKPLISDLIGIEAMHNLTHQSRSLSRLIWGAPTAEDLYIEAHQELVLEETE